MPIQVATLTKSTPAFSNFRWGAVTPLPVCEGQRVTLPAGTTIDVERTTVGGRVFVSAEVAGMGPAYAWVNNEHIEWVWEDSNEGDEGHEEA